ncbi:multicopper oxidase family protein [Acidobacteria bacterium AB60]|nr:multicopper oxidase family protein [Acidobacteria bacterium AB60]
MRHALIKTRTLLAAVIAVAVHAVTAHAAAPGITGPTFNLTAQPAYLTEPDGQSVYSWGYGCSAQPAGWAPAAIAPPTGGCPNMQVPGPTLIVKEGDTVTVKLTNNLPASAGNTSILFPGFTMQPFTDGTAGLLTQEAAPGQTVTYTFVASGPGTRAYYSGTQSDLQVEMGMYGAIIVLPSNVPAACTAGLPLTNPGANAIAKGVTSQAHIGVQEGDFRLAAAAYDNAKTCYDREYLFQFSEMDPNIHTQAESQVAACNAPGAPVPCTLQVPTEPYHPAYFMINGRSMPDDMDPNYSVQYPHQPYNGNPHMHPGELVLLRIIGQGRWQHPFHEHANHVRILARDGNLILTPDGNALAGPALFTTTTTPGLAMDGIFYYTGRGLNWDMYGHNPKSGNKTAFNVDPACVADVNGYYTADPTAVNYFEWCQDHEKPVQAYPTGDITGGGPVTLPDPNILTNGAWYGGSPYLGPSATSRAVGITGTTPPAGTIANSPSGEAGFAFMWHSHNEREITTNNAFPGGMMMMMLVDSREFVIDETN